MTEIDFSNATYEEFVDYFDELLAVSSESLDMEAIRSSKIASQLNRVYGIQSRKLEKLMTMQAKIKVNRYRRLAGKWTAEQYKKEPLHEAILKSDIDKYMEIDEQMIEMNALVNEQERIMILIENSQKEHHRRGFAIKSAIEFRKFLAGQA